MPDSGVTISATPSEASHAHRRPIKILGICCSPRKGKHTADVLKICLDAASTVNRRIEVELIELAEWNVPGEVAASIAIEANGRDVFPGLAVQLSRPSVAGIIVGTPIYHKDVSFLCEAFLHWCMVLHKGKLLANKVGGVVAFGGARHDSAESTVRVVHEAMRSQQMIVAGDAVATGRREATVWGGKSSVGRGATDIALHVEGIACIKNLGRRVAEMALQLDTD